MARGLPNVICQPYSGISTNAELANYFIVVVIISRRYERGGNRLGRICREILRPKGVGERGEKSELVANGVDFAAVLEVQQTSW